jgi:23S rRNA (adenine2030-N6)-methyltransferase
MNYRHAYHAGNHADVLRHIVYARTLDLMGRKLKPYFVLDAHAGPALHQLSGEEAAKTEEWKSGVGRLFDTQGRPVVMARAAEAVAEPWRRCVHLLNPNALTHYPGSPQIARRLMRAGDRLHLNELHPREYAVLAASFAGDAQVRVSALDADVAVKSLLPPAERRGVVLIDPSYERKDEAERALRMLRHGLERFATGVFILWFAIVDEESAAKIARGVAALAAPKTWIAELRIKTPQPQGGLVGSGLVLINPPWPLEEELPVLLPELQRALAQDDGATWRIEAI